MGKETGIGWTDHTFNIAWGCMKVSPGCKNCYADTFAKRTGHNVWGPKETTSRRTFGAKHWAEPMAWNEAAKREGVRKRVFCSSMCDVFEDHPTIDAEREKLWPLIRATPKLDWQLLTKRPERIAANLPADWREGWPNVWLGTSVESREYLERIAALRHTPARLRFLSIEPLLGVMPTLRFELAVEPFIDWIIFGGESGPGHREMPMDGFMAGVEAARDAGSKVFVKQDSGPKPGRQGRIPDSHWIQEMPD
jgi:protein gp37